jgi:hypothetical protein
MMNRLWTRILLSLPLLVASADAQTTVTTTGGTTNKVPYFTGASTLGNSVMSQSNGNIGINTATPNGSLDVYGQGLFYTNSYQFPTHAPYGGNIRLDANTTYAYFVANTYWNGTLGSDARSYTGGGGFIAIDVENNSNGGNIVFDTTPAGNQGTAATYSEQMRITQAGNIGMGTAFPGAKLEVNGNLKLTSGSGASLTFADGTVQSTAYTGVTCGGDYAESVDVSGDHMEFEPGDLLALDTNNPGKVLKSAEPYSTLVSGIYSTKPGTLGRRQATPKVTNEVPMAMVGIVPAKVSTENGPIRIGDLLVSSATPGYAMKGTDHSRMMGTVIGKAMGALDGGMGVIEVLVMLQ